jgi:hypothetical protein
MSNPLTDVRTAIWTLLDAHAGLTAFMGDREGTRYRFGECENLPQKLAADDCPALVVAPGEAEVDWETTAARGITYRVEVRGYLDSTAADEIEEFSYLVYSALVAGLPDFGVDAVEGIEFAGPVFGAAKTLNARFREFRLGVLARIHSEAGR